MRSRLDLHDKLVSILGSNHVYFQPPEDIRLKYPCIIYERVSMDIRPADDMKYSNLMRYDIKYITKEPDTNDFIVNFINAFNYCSYDRHYVYDNLNHEVFTLFY